MKKAHYNIFSTVFFLGICLIFLFNFGHKVSAVSVRPPADEPGDAIYRLYNPNSGEHLFTPSIKEQNALVNFGWKDEGIGFYGQNVERTSRINYVKRVYNPNAGDHHYTANNDEVRNLIKVGWKNDNISLSVPSTAGQPVFRLYNPNAKAGVHHFTLYANERDNLTKKGWKYEGVAFNAFSSNK